MKSRRKSRRMRGKSTIAFDSSNTPNVSEGPGKFGLIGPVFDRYMYGAYIKNSGLDAGIWVDKKIYDMVVANQWLHEDHEDYLSDPDRMGKFYDIAPLVETVNDEFTGFYRTPGLDGQLDILPLYDFVRPEEVTDNELIDLLTTQYRKFQNHPELYQAEMKRYRKETNKSAYRR
jgi:hypothetical protein